MIFILYLFTMAGAAAQALHQTNLIKANRPIRHKLWLTIYVAIGLVFAWLYLHSLGWAILALVGMAGIWSYCFRGFLNAMRGLNPSYMGPDPLDTSEGRSRYDLFMWRIAAPFKWQPIQVAQFIERGTALVVAVIIIFLHPVA